MLLWGTNPPDGTGAEYGGRMHVLAPDALRRGLCGLPVRDVWQQRPPQPDRLCALCCVRALAALYPAWPDQPDR